jgi:hypothetical protein
VSGGLLYIAILAMWAVVLIPMWWRGRDQSHPTRSIDRFHGAMRTLSDVAVESIDPSIVAPVEERPRLTAVQRRQRVFAGLLGLLLVTIVAVVAGAVSIGATALPMVLIGLFTAAARKQVLLERQIRVRRLTAPHAMQVQPQATSVGRSVDERESAPAAQEVSTVIPSAEPAPAARGVRFDDRTWSASPATLPTYINAPAATRVPRVIDLKTPGAWSARSMLREADEVRSARLAAEVAAAIPEPHVPASFTERFVDDTAEVPLAQERDDLLEQIVRRVVNE